MILIMKKVLKVVDEYAKLNSIEKAEFLRLIHISEDEIRKRTIHKGD